MRRFIVKLDKELLESNFSMACSNFITLYHIIKGTKAKRDRVTS